MTEERGVVIEVDGVSVPRGQPCRPELVPKPAAVRNAMAWLAPEVLASVKVRERDREKRKGARCGNLLPVRIM